MSTTHPSDAVSSGLRPMLRPCKEDIESLLRKHPLKGGSGTSQQKAKEARDLLLAYGPLIGTYPCWHPIRRFLALVENHPALELDPSPPPQFDHPERFQWALVGWPYTSRGLHYDFEARYASDLQRLGLRIEAVPSCLYNDGTPNAIVLAVEPVLIRWYRGLSTDGWRTVVQGGSAAALVEYSACRGADCIETFADTLADLVGSSTHHPGLHGTLHEAFDTEFLRHLEPWHYAVQYYCIREGHGDVGSEAYKKIIEKLGVGAKDLVRDSLLAARTI